MFQERMEARVNPVDTLPSIVHWTLAQPSRRCWREYGRWTYHRGMGKNYSRNALKLLESCHCFQFERWHCWTKPRVFSILLSFDFLWCVPVSHNTHSDIHVWRNRLSSFIVNIDAINSTYTATVYLLLRQASSHTWTVELWISLKRHSTNHRLNLPSFDDLPTFAQ